jgi:hypothetical protein
MFCSRNGRCWKPANSLDQIGREGQHFVISTVRDVRSALGGHIVRVVPMSPDDQMTRVAAPGVIARVHDDPMRFHDLYRPVLDRVRYAMGRYDFARNLESADIKSCAHSTRRILGSE